MTTITLPRHDVTKFCRFCLSEINLLNVIGTSAEEQETHGELLRIVNNYLKIEFDPVKDFPSAICEMCIALLHDFDTLYRNAHDYNYALRLLAESPRMADIETEIPVNTIESGLGNIYEPSPLVFIEMQNNAYEEELLATNALDGQIVLEDVPVSEIVEQEAQIDVYHVDGQLQHIVMEGGTCIEIQSEETPKSSPPQRANLLNASLAKTGPNILVRKRITPPYAAPSPQLPKKPVPMKPSTIPVNNTTTRTLNVEANTKRFPPQAENKQYVAAAGPKQLYRCNHCTNLFVELSNLYSHNCPKRQRETAVQNNSTRPTVVPNDGQRIKCKMCNMSYRTKLQYQKHEYEVHGIRNENFGIKCTICQKLFSQRQDYQLHMRAIHPTPGMGFVKVHSQ
ncbi:uncharacterized protein LOC128298080 [Anopheles moucheti]|uniref:uncharacterized protein LOC128298080 n=1 Tax=Anopheles moucheti TaxID=186751 RepID=UPI0022F0749F|nr:uncharacterized protein LOC128298080 [Anopheles moucheti]